MTLIGSKIMMKLLIRAGGLAFLLGAVTAHAAETGSGDAAPKELATVRLQNCNPILNVAVSPLIVGNKLGFFEEEGIGSVLVANSSGSTAQCIQLTAVGQSDFTSPVPDLLLNSAAQGVDPGIKCTFDLIRRPTMAFMVDANSAIKSFADAQGKVIGIHAQASAYIPLFEAAMKEQGGDPSTVEYRVTGYGAQVIDALKTGKVDGAVYWDYEAAGYPAAGYEPRVITPPANVQSLFSSCIAFNKDFIEEHPDLVSGYLRGLTKSLIFAKENPRATVEIFWEMVPEAKPTNVDYEVALKQAETVLASRLVNQVPGESDPDPRWGAWAGPEQWVKYAEFLGIADKVDTTQLYTTEFIDAANDFDHAAIVEFAKNFKP